MNTSPLEILAAAPRIIKTPGGEVQVHEMNWLDLLQFLEKASGQIGTFLGARNISRSSPEAFDLGELPKIIMAARDLTSDLVAKSTGKTNDWIDQQSPRVILQLVTVALEVNLTEELFSLGKAAGAQFMRATPLAAPTAK